MKTICLCLFALLLHEASAGVARKQPQYAKPVYSDSYVPAAMQVIFYAVEQIKTFPPAEEASSSTTLPTTVAHAPGQHQPVATTSKPTVMPMMQTPEVSQAAVVVEAAEETSTLSASQEISVESSTSSISSSSLSSEQNISEQTIPESSTSIQETPEVSNETPEMDYATPETNHETPEASQEIPEVNQEISIATQKVTAEDESAVASGVERTTVQMTPVESSTKAGKESSEESSSSSEESKEDKDDKKKDKDDGDKDKRKGPKPTIDSVVQEIYGIVKKNKGSESVESSGSSSEEKKMEKVKSMGEDGEEEEDGAEEDDEIRFSQLGEKVFQVPRPSLLTYLKRARITMRCSLEQLAILYDALSKDARRQGFVKFSGYSDRVLKTLETSAEGGMGPQLQLILEKIVQRNEVTRDDTKARVAEAIKDLKQPGSPLNRELRRLLPLNFKL